MLIGPSGKCVLLNPFPFGIGLKKLSLLISITYIISEKYSKQTVDLKIITWKRKVCQQKSDVKKIILSTIVISIPGTNASSPVIHVQF